MAAERSQMAMAWPRATQQKSGLYQLTEEIIGIHKMIELIGEDWVRGVVRGF